MRAHCQLKSCGMLHKCWIGLHLKRPATSDCMKSENWLRIDLSGLEIYLQWKTNRKLYMAYQIAATAVTLNDFEGHSPVAGYLASFSRYNSYLPKN